MGSAMGSNERMSTKRSMGYALLTLVAAAGLSIALHTLVTGISPMPSSRRARRAMLALLPAEVDGVIFELGAGWGTLALPLARRYPRCRVVAVELSPVPWLVSRLRRAWSGLANLEVRRADIHRTPLGDAGLVICYLYPGAMERLRPRLERELPPGCLVFSNCFRVPGWRPSRVVPFAGWFGDEMYLYRVPDAFLDLKLPLPRRA
jgi:hypothetical protein